MSGVGGPSPVFAATNNNGSARTGAAATDSAKHGRSAAESTGYRERPGHVGWVFDLAIPLALGITGAWIGSKLLVPRASSARGQLAAWMLPIAAGTAAGVGVHYWRTSPRDVGHVDPLPTATKVASSKGEKGELSGRPAATADDGKVVASLGLQFMRTAGYASADAAVESVPVDRNVAVVRQGERFGIYEIPAEIAKRLDEPVAGQRAPRLAEEVAAVVTQEGVVWHRNGDSFTLHGNLQSPETDATKADRLLGSPRVIGVQEVGLSHDMEMRPGMIVGEVRGYGELSDAVAVMHGTQGDQVILRDPNNGRYVVADTRATTGSDEGDPEQPVSRPMARVRGIRVADRGAIALEINGRVMGNDGTYWAAFRPGKDGRS